MSLSSKRQPAAAGSVEQTLSDWLRQQGLVRTRLVIGVSGGADSVALLRAAHACRGSLQLELVVAHLDHALRAASQEDATWVRGLSAALGLPVVTERLDVGRLADETGQGIEEAARQARFDFFMRTATEHTCTHVAVAHTADDQAETILHHLIRGTGLAGLRGMPGSRPLAPGVSLIRPLLDASRADILSYLGELGQEHRVDATNDDEQFTRNRVRHTLLPLLREQFNPQVADALTRLGRQVEEVQQIIEQLAGRLLESAVIERQPERVVLDCQPLQEADRHIVRESLRLLWTQQPWPRRRMGYDDWDRLAELAQSRQSSKSLTLPHGVTAARTGLALKLTHVSMV